jgi:Leucine-rich repeat (LRR) protein
MKYLKTYKLFEGVQKEMDVSNKKLTKLPELPNSLKSLYCDYNNLTKLPELPNSLEKLICHNNQLTKLPELPNSLKKIYCHYNNLTKLPELPNSLKKLYCHNNQLTKLPELPDSLNYLYCYNNNLTKLPELPNSLLKLDCFNNPFKEPIKKEIIEKFELDENKLYTTDSIELFKSYNFQKQFLTDNPTRYMDIEEWLRPEIKEEFAYLYDSDEFGII